MVSTVKLALQLLLPLGVVVVVGVESLSEVLLFEELVFEVLLDHVSEFLIERNFLRPVVVRHNLGLSDFLDLFLVYFLVFGLMPDNKVI